MQMWDVGKETHGPWFCEEIRFIRIGLLLFLFTIHGIGIYDYLVRPTIRPVKLSKYLALKIKLGKTRQIM